MVTVFCGAMEVQADRGTTDCTGSLSESDRQAIKRIPAGMFMPKGHMTNERKNITQPSDWWAAFEEQAKAEGLTLAAWLGEAAKARLPPKVAKKLTERPPANRPPKAKD